MTFDRRALGGALAMLLLVAACGGGASQAPTTEPGTSQPATEAPTATPEETPAAGTPEPAETEEATLQPGAAGDLEALLPAEVNGVAFEKASFDGGSVPGGIPLGEGDDDFAAFLADNGKSISDVNVAIASTTDSAASGSFVMAIQVEGVSGDKLAEFATGGMDGAEQTTIGGKTVYGSGMAGFAAYVYPKGDTVFYVFSVGSDASLAEGILSQLP
jgi:hypothetical protein